MTGFEVLQFLATLEIIDILGRLDKRVVQGNIAYFRQRVTKQVVEILYPVGVQFRNTVETVFLRQVPEMKKDAYFFGAGIFHSGLVEFAGDFRPGRYAAGQQGCREYRCQKATDSEGATGYCRSVKIIGHLTPPAELIKFTKYNPSALACKCVYPS